MDLIRVTKIFTFDMAHALYGYDGPCKNIHGHTYRLSVTLLGAPLYQVENPKDGMVIDFSELKQQVKSKIINIYDHALVLNGDSPHRELHDQLKMQFESILYVPFQPTCERMLLHFVGILRHAFSEKELVYMKLEETPTSYSEWLFEDNK